MRTRHHGLPVANAAGELVGILTVGDIDRAEAEHPDEALTVGQVCSRNLLVAYPDETFGVALRRMGMRDVGRLPVVARDQPRRLLGLLRRTDLVRAYDIALARREAMRHRVQQVRLGAVGGVGVEEVVIEAGAACVGHQIREVTWPRDCILATLRRGRQTIIPRGDTQIEAGDVLAVVVEGETRIVLQDLCRKPSSRAAS
jgi:CIC family chloride channel protein